MSAPICFVLVEPTHPGNVGAAARAIATMGFTDLRIVATPIANVREDPEARARASAARDVVANAQLHDTLESAVADATLVIGLSARVREFAPAAVSIESACAEAAREAATGQRVAFVFGTERIGLNISQAQRCLRLAQIDAEADRSSLNVAQAVQIAAYEMRGALGSAGSSLLDPEVPDYATQDEIEQLYAHLRDACVAVGFIDPEHPKKLFERMRRLFSRTRLEREEVQLLRGLCKQMILAGKP
ncbi:RNA methyltransferase [soil metagenome]